MFRQKKLNFYFCLFCLAMGKTEKQKGKKLTTEELEKQKASKAQADRDAEAGRQETAQKRRIQRDKERKDWADGVMRYLAIRTGDDPKIAITGDVVEVLKQHGLL
jgi:hypothetical protein